MVLDIMIRGLGANQIGSIGGDGKDGPSDTDFRNANYLPGYFNIMIYKYSYYLYDKKHTSKIDKNILE